MTAVSPAVLFHLADALESLESAYEELWAPGGDQDAAVLVGEAVARLQVVLALIEPDLDRLAQAAAGMLEDDD